MTAWPRLQAGRDCLAGPGRSGPRRSAAGPSPPRRARRRPPASSSWTAYHGDPAGLGVAGPVSAVDTTARAWTSPALDGHLYGEPLVSGGEVFVATENDTVYALSASTGAVTWTTHWRPGAGVGPPVRRYLARRGHHGYAGDRPGTGRDLRGGRRAGERSGGAHAGRPRHEYRQGGDDPGRRPRRGDTAALLQRTGLTLDAGQVVFGIGGNFGDCASYRGRVVAVPETGGTPAYFTVDSAAGDSPGSGVDGRRGTNGRHERAHLGHRGNGSVHSSGQAYDDSDSALELSSSLQLLGYFAPSNWPQNNAADLDLSVAPALLSDGQVWWPASRASPICSTAPPGGIGAQEAASARPAARTSTAASRCWARRSSFLAPPASWPSGRRSHPPG